MKVKVFGQLELEQPLRVPIQSATVGLWTRISKLPRTTQHAILKEISGWDKDNTTLLQPLYDDLATYFKERFEVDLESIDKLQFTDILADTLNHLNEPTPASYFIRPEYITTEVCLTFSVSKNQLNYYRAQEEYYGNNHSEEVDTLYNISKRRMRGQVEGVYKNKDNHIKDFCIFNIKVVEDEQKDEY